MGGGASKTNEEVKAISRQGSIAQSSQQPQNARPQAVPKQQESEPQPQSFPNIPRTSQVMAPGMAQPSSGQQSLRASMIPIQPPPQRPMQDPYEKLALRAKQQLEMEQRQAALGILPVQQTPPRETAKATALQGPIQQPSQMMYAQNQANISQPPGMGGPRPMQQMPEQPTMSREKPPQVRSQKTKLESGRRDENTNPAPIAHYQQLAGNIQGSNQPSQTASATANGSFAGEKPSSTSVFNRQGTNSVPQISFQVNVATVEYSKGKKGGGLGMSMGPGAGGGFGNSFSVVEMPTAFHATGPSTMGNGGMLGFDNSNDRGDEINLDELQRYIGGGARGF